MMTGNEQQGFSRTNQGPRGMAALATGAVPNPRRRRRPLINIVKIDAEAKAANAKKAAEDAAKLARGEKLPEPKPDTKPDLPANSRDSYHKLKESTLEEAAAAKGASRGALSEDDQGVGLGPVPGQGDEPPANLPDVPANPEVEDRPEPPELPETPKADSGPVSDSKPGEPDKDKGPATEQADAPAGEPDGKAKGSTPKKATRTRTIQS